MPHIYYIYIKYPLSFTLHIKAYAKKKCNTYLIKLSVGTKFVGKDYLPLLLNRKTYSHNLFLQPGLVFISKNRKTGKFEIWLPAGRGAISRSDQVPGWLPAIQQFSGRFYNGPYLNRGKTIFNWPITHFLLQFTTGLWYIFHFIYVRIVHFC